MSRLTLLGFAIVGSRSLHLGQVLTNAVTGEVVRVGEARAKWGPGAFGFRATGFDSSFFWPKLFNLIRIILAV